MKDNKVLLYIVAAFLVGGALAMILLPEKIVRTTEKIEVIKEVEVIKEIRVEVEVIKEVIKEVVKNVRKVTRTETFPDGRIVKEEIYESNEAQVSRITEQMQQTFDEKLVLKEAELEREYSKAVEITNPKRLNVLVGMSPYNRELAGSLSYKLGFVNVGVIATQTNIYTGIGISF